MFLKSSRLWVSVVFVSTVVSACGGGGGGSSSFSGEEDILEGTTTGDIPTGGTIPDGTATGGTVPDETTAGGTVPDGATTGGTPTGPTSLSSIQGVWVTACIDDGVGLTTAFGQSQLTFSGSNVFTNVASFSDPDCTVPASILLGIDGSTLQQTGTITSTGETVETTLGTALAIDIFLEPPTIDNQPPPPELAALFGPAEEFFDIALVDGDMLFFGDASLEGFDRESPETRPISLDFDPINVFTRVP